MNEEPDDREKIGHSLAHLLAAAVNDLYPDAHPAIGPAIENGFYYDFEFQHRLPETDLPKIEAKMREILKGWKGFERHAVSKAEALAEFGHNPYKKELIEEITEGWTVYQSGSFRDLCRGGHVERTSAIGVQAFKLTHLAGAYWRGDVKNTMLTRIYGLAFSTKKELDDHIAMLEEAKKRDHKKLGRELDLFTFSELVGAGLPLWTPKGTLLRDLLDEFVWSLRRPYGYEKVEIPHITKKDLYEKSGHWDKFKDELFKIKTREGHQFAMKPMNCPHHTQIFKRKRWSYREMPQRYANTTMCYRDEQTGELNGLSRVRSITQDDAHVFCRANQVQQEMDNIWNIIESFYERVGFGDLKVRLSLHDSDQPEKYLGDTASWRYAEGQLRALALRRGDDFLEAKGEAAFYGPKLDFMSKDSLGREWQVATIQLDLNMPERFDLTYINEEGKEEEVVMIHAAIMGAIERFISILLEHNAGVFPLWLAPMQVAVLPVAERHADYAKKVEKQLKQLSIRAAVDERGETLGKRIREHELQKVPYILVVGDKEIFDKTVTVRQYGSQIQTVQPAIDFTNNLIAEIAHKR